MSVKERLKEFIKSKDLSVRAFEIKCMLSNGLVNNITESVSKATIDKISKEFPDINFNWLLTGDGKMIKDESRSDVDFYDIPTSTIKAPLIGQYANGGYLRGYADPEYLEEQPVFYSTRKHSGGNYVAFEVS